MTAGTTRNHGTGHVLCYDAGDEREHQPGETPNASVRPNDSRKLYRFVVRGNVVLLSVERLGSQPATHSLRTLSFETA